MERNLTFKRVLALLVVAVSFVLNAKAGSTWYAYYAQLNAYPTGAGQVYLSPDYDLDPAAITDWKDVDEKEFVALSGDINGYAKPAAGWILAGFSEATFDENGENPTFSEEIVVRGNPGALTVPSTVTDDAAGTGESDSTTVSGMMPLDPNGVFYAIFTHVVAEVAAGQDLLGEVEISKVSNNIGDQVTLTATPGSDYPNTKFEKWTLGGQTVSTSATLQVTVQDTARYVAHFTSDAAETIDFGEGKYMMLYPGDNTNISIPSNVQTLTFVADSMHLASVDGKNTYAQPLVAGYNIMAGDPVIVYGEGEATLVREETDEAYPNEASLNHWAAEATPVASLPVGYAYYTFDTASATLHLQEAGATIAAGQVYVAVPDTCYKSLASAPAIIYLSPEAAVTNGIGGVAAAPTAAKAATKGIYTLDGRRVEAMRESGVYVFDGRKVVYRKK